MTKNEIREYLNTGKALCDVLELAAGQECGIYKALTFDPAAPDEVAYIPDMCLNEIPSGQEDLPPDVIEDILRYCYTMQDFIDEMEGDIRKAEDLFHFCDWQHPISAAFYMELCGWWDDEEL